METLDQLADQLANGTSSARTTGSTSRALIEAAIEARARARHVFIAVDDAAALEAADAIDRRRARGDEVNRYAGIPISAKDLFDVAGQVTRAGSRVLADAPPAALDAPVIARLRQAGFVIMGRTNMTEFAYSGLGVNPHYGTPANPYQPHGEPRIPGGSSSGAAVSVAFGMAAGAIGTDTGGSCRIPAAFCGLAGFKPTAHRVSRDGVYPLSRTLDSVGPLARSARCCQILDAIMSGESTGSFERPVDVGAIRFGVLQDYVTADLDPVVASAYEAALGRLSDAGVDLADVRCSELDALPQINAKGGIAAAEAFHLHRQLLARAGNGYDPRVRSRIAAGGELSAADYLDCVQAREDMMRWAREAFAAFDAMVLPTVPIIAPTLAQVSDEANYVRLNLLALRNPSVANFLNGCAISLPIQAPGEAPVGFTLMAVNGDDARLLDIAKALEKTVRPGA